MNASIKIVGIVALCCLLIGLWGVLLYLILTVNKNRSQSVCQSFQYNEDVDVVDDDQKEVVVWNIITPCSRPHNLMTMYEYFTKTIFPFVAHWPIVFHWVIVYDATTVPEPSPLSVPEGEKGWIIEDAYYDIHSIKGNAQRNHALRYLERPGWIYFWDDDTLCPYELFALPMLEPLDPAVLHTITCFTQEKTKTKAPLIERYKIDTGCIFLHTDLLGDDVWSTPDRKDKLGNDFYFCDRMYKRASKRRVHHPLRVSFQHNVLSKM